MRYVHSMCTDSSAVTDTTIKYDCGQDIMPHQSHSDIKVQVYIYFFDSFCSSLTLSLSVLTQTATAGGTVDDTPVPLAALAAPVPAF
jgi:hypothetical protein